MLQTSFFFTRFARRASLFLFQQRKTIALLCCFFFSQPIFAQGSSDRTRLKLGVSTFIVEGKWEITPNHFGADDRRTNGSKSTRLLVSTYAFYMEYLYSERIGIGLGYSIPEGRMSNGTPILVEQKNDAGQLNEYGESYVGAFRQQGPFMYLAAYMMPNLEDSNFNVYAKGGLYYLTGPLEVKRTSYVYSGVSSTGRASNPWTELDTERFDIVHQVLLPYLSVGLEWKSRSRLYFSSKEYNYGVSLDFGYAHGSSKQGFSGSRGEDLESTFSYNNLIFSGSLFWTL